MDEVTELKQRIAELETRLSNTAAAVALAHKIVNYTILQRMELEDAARVLVGLPR